MKLNATNRSTLNMIAAVVVLLVIIMFMRPTNNVSKYQPREITVKPVSDESIFTLTRGTECLAGPTKESDFYNIDVQGICGGQKLVRDHASYEIDDGIGGVLI
jgi:hypothetical protein